MNASCLVRRKPKTGTRPIRDITGLRVKKLVAVKFVGFMNDQAAWECRCDCGGKKIVRGPFMVQAAKGNQTYLTRCTWSCGCDSKKHGHSKQPGYVLWARLKYCMCEEWQDFPAFAQQCYANRPTK